MAQEIRDHQFSNGLVLLAERMDWVESAAFTILLTAGCTRDPDNRLGLANFACEMAQRGCGDYNSREFIQALDRLGADRGGNVSPAHTNFSAAMLGENLSDVLKLYADLVRRPHLPESQLEESRQVCFHELHSLEDELASRAMQNVRRLAYGQPWGRRAAGELDHVGEISYDDVVGFVGQNYIPQNAIISVAGKIEWEKLKDDVESFFGDWSAQPQPELTLTAGIGGYEHVQHESGQTQIAVAYPTVPYAHKDYYQSRGAVGVLSDGMSSRLFTEVREVRGLCYSVFASYHSLRHEARIISYVGTSTDRAQESLDVLLHELQNMASGINDNELKRLKARVRSALIMQQEMSTARSGSIASDWFHLGRVRTMDEVSSLIEGLTCESVNQFLAANPPRDFTIVTLGSQPLETSVGVS